MLCFSPIADDPAEGHPDQTTNRRAKPDIHTHFSSIGIVESQHQRCGPITDPVSHKRDGGKRDERVDQAFGLKHHGVGCWISRPKGLHPRHRDIHP